MNPLMESWSIVAAHAALRGERLPPRAPDAGATEPRARAARPGLLARAVAALRRRTGRGTIGPRPDGRRARDGAFVDSA